MLGTNEQCGSTSQHIVVYLLISEKAHRGLGCSSVSPHPIPNFPPPSLDAINECSLIMDTAISQVLHVQAGSLYPCCNNQNRDHQEREIHRENASRGHKPTRADHNNPLSVKRRRVRLVYSGPFVI